MRKKSNLLLEILIWIFLLGGLIFLGVNISKFYFSSQKSYQVIFRDVDGLTIGSPVRLMGIQVGYVSEVKPINNEVFVRLKITNDKVSLPKGSTTGIQFTGLAGSKSLEIQPPKEPAKNGSYLNVLEPVRINSLMEVQAKVSQSILNSSENTREFFGKGGLEVIKKNIKFSSSVTQDAINNFDQTTRVLKDTDQTLSAGIGRAKEFLQGQNKDIESLYNEYTDSYLSQNTRQKIESLKNRTEKIGNNFEDGTIEKRKQKLAHNVEKLNKNINGLHNKVANHKKSSISSKFHKASQNFKNNIQSVYNFVSSKLNSANISKLHNKCKAFKNSTECLEKGL